MFGSFNQQQQQGQQQPASGAQQQPFGSSSFGGFGNAAQQGSQQQQQPNGTPGAGFGSPMTLQELGGSQKQVSFAPQQQQQQPQQPGQGFGGFGAQQQAPNTFSQFGAQQQPQQGQQLPMQQQGGFGSFGPSGNPYQQSQPSWGPSASPFPGQPGFDAQGMMAGQPQQQAQPQNPPQQVYLPGYLSRMKNQRPYSPSASRAATETPSSPPKEPESTPPTSASAQTSATPSRSSRDGGRRTSLDAGPSSPTQGFSSSFFSSPEGAPTRRTGPENIFGSSGLRGSTNRRSMYAGSFAREGSAFGTPARETRDARSSSFLRASSVGSPPLPSALSSSMAANDEDDAPPSEALADADASRGDFTSSFGGNDSIVVANQSSMGVSPPSTVNYNSQSLSMSQAPSRPSSVAYRSPAESSICTLLLYGFPSSLSQTVLSHFGTIGEITSSSSLASADAGGASECLRIVYAAPQYALRALRRSGELVAGVAYVGVRFADESLHNEVLMNGINSPLLAGIGGSSLGASSSTAEPSNPAASKMTSSMSMSVLPSSSSTRNGPRSSMGLLGRGQPRESTPASSSLGVGRPINIVDSPAAALRARNSVNAPSSGSSSPFGKVTGLFGSSVSSSAQGTPGKASPALAPGQKAANGNQAGVMGRIGDAIFGW